MFIVISYDILHFYHLRQLTYDYNILILSDITFLLFIASQLHQMLTTRKHFLLHQIFPIYVTEKTFHYTK